VNQPFLYIGKNVPKVDAFEKVTGSALYGHDIIMPGMLYGKILRSKYAHARIVSIDTRRARSVPGVKAILTAFDVKCKNVGFLDDQPVLKGDKVRSFRDEVAAVAALTPQSAEEACRLIEVKYEPLPAVFDPFEAMKKGAPLIHENCPGNVPKHSYEFKHGDCESALKKCKFVVSGTYKTHYVTHCCMETCFTLAVFGRDGHLTLYSSTQIPYLLQYRLSDVLGIPGYKIRVKQPIIGGAFGSKLDVYPYEVITILLAQATGHPVKLTYSREEEFECTPTRQPMVIDMTTGCDHRGKLIARKCVVTLDNGAYTSWGFTTPHIVVTGISSLYRVENVFFKALSVYTNNPYAGAFRGYGNPQGTFANEQQMDELAAKVGIDPVKFRLMNANEPNSITPQGFKVTTCGFKQCIEEASKRIGFHLPKGPNEGVGIAGMFHVGGGARVYKSDACGAIVKLDDFGRLSIITGATEIGTGSDTGIAILAAEELGLPLDAVSVINNDTDVCPWDVGIHASRMTFIGGNAVIRACREIKEQLSQYAAEILSSQPSVLFFRDGKITDKTNPKKSIDIVTCVRSLHFRNNGEMFVGKAFYDPPNEFQSHDMRGNISSTYAFAAHAVRVKIDPETGKVKVIKFVAVHDVGKVINRLGLTGQIEGAIIQGLGYALTEQLQFEQGKLINNSYKDYKMLLSRDVPRDIEIEFVETQDPEGPYGSKGVSEAGLIPIPAAVANAIADALGKRIYDLPLTPEKILQALKLSGKN
jgi:CO/xanthine dehydrogenase Mo-binding subunit